MPKGPSGLCGGAPVPAVVGRVGDVCNYALCESFFATLERELAG